ncbi:hypothetical protein [Desulfovirgula thermocuniculi]|uniref:hypothetical protein n=1 Tax=Desulfovirgula thermocuniculi TaxID=348842 RepID=UPI0004244F12|nr:hypothetical protein [Desulfovirgula thermocuniculi]
MRIETVCIRGQDARRFFRWGACGYCRKPARQWAGNRERIEAHAAYDREGNMLGFLCPDCAAGLKEALEKLGVAEGSGRNGETQNV